MTKMTNQVARQLFAMSKKTKSDPFREMRNERYQRTFTDEQFPHKPRGNRFKPVDEEQKREWRMLAERTNPYSRYKKVPPVA
jgi:hypothetical protein